MRDCVYNTHHTSPPNFIQSYRFKHVFNQWFKYSNRKINSASLQPKPSLNCSVCRNMDNVS